MNDINIEETVNLVLADMYSKGKSEKTIRDYSTTGFGAYIRYFTKNGIKTVSPDDIDKFLIKERSHYDNGKMSAWKWRLIRRGGELLKAYSVTEKSDLTPLRPWNPSVNRPFQSLWIDNPTDEQLADPDNIFHLVWKTKKHLEKLGLTSSSVRHYTNEGLSVILRLHYDNGTESYFKEYVDNAVKEKRCQYKQGKISRQAYQNLRKAASLLDEMHTNGFIHLERLSNWELKQLPPEYNNVVNDFINWANKHSRLAASTIMGSKSAIRQFLFAMEELNVLSISGFNGLTINMAVSRMAQRYSGGLASAMFSIRIFLHFLYENGFTTIDFVCNMPELVSHKKKYHEGFSQNEVKLLLNQPDRETSEGKRNYAILVLALQTGLRACDIVRLKRTDINWNTCEINITQHKTARPLSVVLQPESSNALIDYLSNVRKDDFPYVFTCMTGVMRPLNSRSASGLVTRLMKQAGIYSPSERQGFHSLRRTFGTSLLQSETPTQLIMQLLGHWHPDSMVPYLSVDEQGLKCCTINLAFGQEDNNEI